MVKGPAGSAFGFSVTSLGDANRDSYHDFAIGAPYQKNKGAVYIFNGAKMWNSRPSQTINDLDIDTLGISLKLGIEKKSRFLKNL
jgi:integrin alpha 7